MQKGKIVFVGNFWEYFGLSIALLILSIITFGIALPYWVYWSFKYFFRVGFESHAARTNLRRRSMTEAA